MSVRLTQPIFFGTGTLLSKGNVTGIPTSPPMSFFARFNTTGAMGAFGSALINITIMPPGFGGSQFQMLFISPDGKIGADSCGPFSDDQVSAHDGPWTANVDHTAGAVFASQSSRLVYFDGTAGVENTVDRSVSGLEDILIGAAALVEVGDFTMGFDGCLRDITVWDVALSPEEMLAAHSLPAFTAENIPQPDRVKLWAPLINEASKLNAYAWDGTALAPIDDLIATEYEPPGFADGDCWPDAEESGATCPSSSFDLAFPPCVTTWTQCVKIQRRDGVTFRFTSLDQDIDFRGETYVTCGSLDPSATQVTAQVGEVGSSELAGLITTTGVSEQELYGGLFDDAFVEIWLVPYEGEDSGANAPRRLAAGWAGKVSHSTRGYKMEVLGPGSRLEQRPIVQVYSPQCRWVFGDSRCTIDIESLAIVGTVTSGINRGSVLADLGDPASSGTGAPESSGSLPAQFANGRVRWLTGVNAGQVTEVKSVDFETGQIILWALTCFVPEAGDTFDLLPGCAQDFETCKTVYDNVLNFGGFPYVPGRDAIMESPNAKNG